MQDAGAVAAPIYSSVGAYDEMLGADGAVRPHWRYLADALGGLGAEALAERGREARRLLRESGVSYTIYDDPHGLERPWKLDPVPFLIASDEWSEIESGLMQRAEVLNLLLEDLYGEQQVIKRGLLPAELVFAHGGFQRACYGIESKVKHALVLYAADLARGPAGRMWVLSDRTQVPSGSGYALENRLVMRRLLPSLFRDSHVHRLALYFRELRASLTGLAGFQDREPRIVVLTPGPRNETYFEHAYLASYLGYTLARGDDLTVRDGRVWLRSTRRLEPVDVIVRRVDDHYCDPLELYPDSRLGIPGLTEAVRRGHVVVVNPLGSSVLENPALNAFLPGIAQHFLGRDLELPSAATWWCGEDKERAHVLANLDQLVVRPIYRGLPGGPYFGAQLDADQRRDLTRRIERQPHLYVGQEHVKFSHVPTLVGSRLEARRAIVRSFLVARDDGYVVMPGALTRVAPAEDSVLLSSQAGGISKDTWILATEPEKQVSLLPSADTRPPVASRRAFLPAGAAENLFWFGRYAERAEHGIRLLRIVDRTFENYLEQRATTDRQAFEVLASALGGMPVAAEEDSVESAWRIRQRAILLDLNSTDSVVFDLRAMLTAAFSLRDRLPNDVWRIVEQVRVALAGLPDHEDDRHFEIEDDFDAILTALMALVGLSQDAIMREQGWLFLETGRRLERSTLLTRLLRSTLTTRNEPRVESAVLDGVLEAMQSLMTYRHAYHSDAATEATLNLLLFDRANPRSLRFQLEKLTAHLADLPEGEPAVRLTGEQRLLLEASTRLELADIELLSRFDAKSRVRVVFDEVLGDIAGLLARLSNSLTSEYFVDRRGPQQLQIGQE